MTTKVFSLYIFDRHCNPVYYQDWTHLHQGLLAPLHPATAEPSSSASAVGDTSVDTVAASEASTSTFQSLSSSLRNATQVLASSGNASGSAKGAGPLRKAGEVPPNVTRSVAKSCLPTASKQRSSLTSSVAGTANEGVSLGGNSALPFDEQAKLVYGVVFSLRNMCRKLGGGAAGTQENGVSPLSSASPATAELFNSYTTPTYTLTHFQSPTMYTFVLLTDPMPSATGFGGTGASGSGAGSAAKGSSLPGGGGLMSGYSISSRFSVASSATSSSSNAATALAGGAGSAGAGFASAAGTIPGTGGVTLKSVLVNIWKGPWVQHVARNPLCQSGLERSVQAERAAGVDSDGFRDAVEKLFAQYKLSAPPSPVL
ncbi:hypothetical protein K437DRAFT_258273 [Tilletiaria anomala UBC 951]|uniref:Trafficking protein particle complex subunit n=1 Tax=Tilletiaria anomala (strain ATCC 24038 / CBS 436.72 / UBC 951) TaxID=1037660 RepID=A0A066VSA1_TILAU|nr:uncharacterized protein K437DRAFT_258273 [Tilletiaria anomala UBC 951]KDN41430.1 hypothetical protein K437DRAFT_258273 [Tilletiaria anomala UBC 951]